MLPVCTRSRKVATSNARTRPHHGLASSVEAAADPEIWRPSFEFCKAVKWWHHHLPADRANAWAEYDQAARAYEAYVDVNGYAA
jgi:hypothetical protein